MRIVTIALVTGSVILAVNAKTTPVGNEQQLSQQITIPANADVDRIVTGNTLSKENLQNWEEERKRYLECPSCAADQPFPED